MNFRDNDFVCGVVVWVCGVVWCGGVGVCVLVGGVDVCCGCMWGLGCVGVCGLLGCVGCVGVWGGYVCVITCQNENFQNHNKECRSVPESTGSKR